jgi:NAD(P)-dependent dehydrogenase (short-subunit alcohol dehydrogenase family)
MNKIVVITGSGRGLGYCLTKKNLQMENVVYALEYQITDELRKLEKEYSGLHVSECDVGNNESVKEAVQYLLEKESHIDVFYSVAGIFTYEGKVGLAKTDLDMCMRMYNINALGSLRVCKEVWPLIQKRTLIVIISSEAGSIGASRRNGEYAYCMSKAAVNMLGKILSNELWEIGGRVLLFHPGYMRTPMGGERAKQSSLSVDPSESTENITSIVENIETIPRDQIYMTYKGDILQW